MSWQRGRHACFILLARGGLNVVRPGLRLLGYRRLSRLLLWLSPTPCGGSSFEPRSCVAARLIERVADGQGGSQATCLHRSLLLWWCLRWMGIASELRTGIRQETPGGFSAHAWVEQGGVVINDRLEVVSQYALLWSTLSPDRVVRYQPS